LRAFPSHFCARSLLGMDRIDDLNAEQREFVNEENTGGLSLLDVVKTHKPTMLIGVTAVGGLFTQEIIEAMAENCERPIIFPLSNPTIKAECTATQAYEWTNGRCIFASGSPFGPVDIGDGNTYHPSQCNNMYIFPGLGLGVTVCGAKKVTDRMLYVAAEALANFVPEKDIKEGKVFPSLNVIRDVSHTIAVAVVKEAMREGLSTTISAEDAVDLEGYVARKMYYPEYVPLVEKREVMI